MSLRKVAISGLVWIYAQQFGSQAFGFFVSMILARLVLPAEFGLIGMLSIFMGMATILIQGGMTASLIRTIDTDDVDYSTVFIFNLVVSLALYGMIYVSAPLISLFYNQPELTSLARFYGLNFVAGAFGTVQNTILVKQLRFKKIFIISLPALILSSVVGVYMAWLGWGVWSLAWSYLLNSSINSLFLWLFSRWRPALIFDREKFKTHFGFGYKLTLSGILDVIFTNLYQIVIGRYYSASQVGYYTRANTLMMLPVTNISTALNKVALPVFSNVQEDQMRLKNAYKQIMIAVLFVCTPIVTLMAVLAKPMVLFLFGEKWLPVVPIFYIICIAGILYPLHSYNLIVLQVKGRSDLFLKLEIIKKIIMAGGIALSFLWGYYGLFYAQAASSVIALFINTYYAGRILNYSAVQQMKDCLPVFIFAVIAGVIAWAAAFVLSNTGIFFQLLGGVIAGGLIYLFLATIFRFSGLTVLKNLIIKK